MNSLNFLIQRELDRFQQECRTKRTQILRSEDVFEIARVVEYTHPPATVAFLKGMLTERRHMQSAAEQRARELVQEMSDGKRQPPREGLYRLYRACAGRFPEAARIVDRMMRQERASEAQATPPQTTPGPTSGP